MNAQKLIVTEGLQQAHGAADREHLLATKRVVTRTEGDPDATVSAGGATQEAI
jgi:hypothetical protein